MGSTLARNLSGMTGIFSHAHLEIEAPGVDAIGYQTGNLLLASCTRNGIYDERYLLSSVHSRRNLGAKIQNILLFLALFHKKCVTLQPET